MVELTDILLDAWSMTSIVEPMPGRPRSWAVGARDGRRLPQTTIAWRAELDLPGFDQLDLETIEEWFDTHRILTHETLSVPTSIAAKWFTDRWDQLEDKRKSEVGNRSIVADRAGLKLVTVNGLINQLSRNNDDSISNAELILPASFGGIEPARDCWTPPRRKLRVTNLNHRPKTEIKPLKHGSSCPMSPIRHLTGFDKE